MMRCVLKSNAGENPYARTAMREARENSKGAGSAAPFSDDLELGPDLFHLDEVVVQIRRRRANHAIRPSFSRIAVQVVIELGVDRGTYERKNEPIWRVSLQTVLVETPA